MNAKTLRESAHTMTPSEYGRQLLTLVSSAPEKKFEELIAGLWFYPGHTHEMHNKRIVRVESLSAAGRSAVFCGVNNKGDVQPPGKVYRGSWLGRFHRLDQETVDLCTCTHEFLVRCEVSRNPCAIPPAVRRHYPALFVAIPPAFEAEDVASKLTGWNSVSTQEAFERCLESAHKSVRHHDKDAAPWIVSGQAAQQAHDGERESLVLRVQFYLWLIPLVSPGGVFHIEP